MLVTPYEYFVIQFYPQLNFYFLLFPTYYYHTQKQSFLMCGSLLVINISLMWKQNIIISKVLDGATLYFFVDWHFPVCGK